MTPINELCAEKIPEAAFLLVFRIALPASLLSPHSSAKKCPVAGPYLRYWFVDTDGDLREVGGTVGGWDSALCTAVGEWDSWAADWATGRLGD